MGLGNESRMCSQAGRKQTAAHPTRHHFRNCLRTQWYYKIGRTVRFRKAELDVAPERMRMG